MVARLQCRECGQMNRAGTPCHCGGPKVPAGSGMGSKTLAERLRDAEADEKRLTDELLRAYRAGEFWLTPCASVALDAKDAEIERLREALEFYADRKDWSGRWEFSKDEESGLNIVDIGMAPAMDYGETARAALGK